MFLEKISLSLAKTQETLQNFINDKNNQSKIQLLATEILDCFQNNGKILSCGNGGSMCDAMHFAEELTGRFEKNRKPLAAISLSDAAHLSCVSNDFGFEYVFSRSVEALGKKEDLLLVLSTSGNSKNLIEAVKTANQKKMKVFCLLGKDGGELKNLTKNFIIVDSNSSARIQEIHIKIIHIVIELVETKIGLEI